jgi:hypothetical protein
MTGPAAGHPFYYNYSIAIPHGIHGIDTFDYQVKEGIDIKHDLYKYFGEFISPN